MAFGKKQRKKGTLNLPNTLIASVGREQELLKRDMIEEGYITRDDMKHCRSR